MRFTLSWWNVLLIGGFGLLLAVVSWRATNSQNVSHRFAFLPLGDALVVQRTVFWIIAAFGLVMTAGMLEVVLLRRPTLTLDPYGVHFRQGRREWSMRWGEIIEVSLFEHRIYGVTTQRAVILRDRYGAEQSITNALTISPRRLQALILAEQGSALDAGATFQRHLS